MAEADTKPFSSGVAPKTPPKPSSQTQYAQQLRAAAAAEQSRNPTEARWLRASAEQAEKEAKAADVMREAVSGAPARVTVNEYLGLPATPPSVASKKTEAAQEELHLALRARASPAEIARLKNAVAAATLSETYVRNGVR
jgi:hypothetical protein